MLKTGLLSPLTGGKGALTWGHIEVTLWFLSNLSAHYEVCWAFLQCVPHFDHMLVTFAMSPQSSHWAHFE